VDRALIEQLVAQLLRLPRIEPVAAVDLLDQRRRGGVLRRGGGDEHRDDDRRQRRG
jgi:hypothetical protein